MGCEKFMFVGYVRCPYCRTGMIVIDNEVVSCPVCEVKQQEKAERLGRGNHISQVILI
ncbi:MAG: hypothetical protein ACFFA0_05275 [Promethearchaeota archaeon]